MNMNMTVKGLLLLAVALAAPHTSNARSVDAAGKIAPSPQSVGSMSIAELINSNGNLAVLSTLLSSAGLGSLLEGPGPFTVLAPTNAAFGTYDLNGLLGPANLVKLRKILENHILKGAFRPNNLTNGLVIDTLDGNPLRVVRRTDQGQIAGTYIGPPRPNPLDVTSACAKLTGYESSGMVNASNGVVYTIGDVCLPPNTTTPRVPPPRGAFSGCRKTGCFFSTTPPAPPNTFPCCVQVDAAPRMPPGIFNDTVALEEYVRITQQLSSTIAGRGNLEQGPCAGPNFRANGTLQIDWFEGFKPWCKARCGCGGLLNPCKDVPDDPATHTYCSLCGPKYNQPIDIQFFHNNQVDCASGAI